MNRQRNHSAPGGALFNPAGDLDPGEVGQADIHQHDIGFQSGHRVQGLQPRPGLPNNINIELPLQKHAQPRADYGMVIHQQ